MLFFSRTHIWTFLGEPLLFRYISIWVRLQSSTEWKMNAPKKKNQPFVLIVLGFLYVSLESWAFLLLLLKLKFTCCSIFTIYIKNSQLKIVNYLLKKNWFLKINFFQVSSSQIRAHDLNNSKNNSTQKKILPSSTIIIKEKKKSSLIFTLTQHKNISVDKTNSTQWFSNRTIDICDMRITIAAKAQNGEERNFFIAFVEKFPRIHVGEWEREWGGAEKYSRAIIINNSI